MAFEWKDYLETARELLENSDESSWRTAINRAYYSVMCTARDKKNQSNVSIAVHTTVINMYLNSQDITEKKIGRLLKDLKSERINADYIENSQIKKEKAEECISDAESIFELLAM